MREKRSRSLRRATVLLALLLGLLAACANPVGSDGNDSSGGDIDDGAGSGGGDGTGAGDGTGLPDGDVTITFVLDTNAGDGLTLSTAATAPAPITVTAGEPVRLTQGAGFTATGPGPGGPDSTAFHASGWSTREYRDQVPFILDPTGPAPTGDGWHLPGFDATFTQDTTLYARWLPESDTIAARITYEEPGVGTRTATGPVLHLRDQLSFERTTYFRDVVSAPWTVTSNERVWEWTSATNSTSKRADNIVPGEPAVWQFANATSDPGFLYSQGSPGLRDVRVTYTPGQVYAITFDSYGGTASSGFPIRDAFADQPIANNADWWALRSATRLESPARGDLAFAGWYSDPGAWSSDWYANATADTTLYARWQVDVTFDAMGGTGGGIQTLDVGPDGTVAVPTVTTPHDTWDEFVGWFTTNTHTQEIALVDGRLLVAGNGTVYAGWGPKYAVGDLGPGGGRVFHVADAQNWPRATTNATSHPFEGWKYLEVAPGSAGGSSIFWGLTQTSPDHAGFLTNESHDELGRGINSTNEIISLGDGPVLYGDYAAKVARDQYPSPSTSSDWYLPAARELTELAESGVWQAVGMGTERYWSSSSYDGSSYATDPMDGHAFAVRLESGSPVVERVARNPSGALRVRPVRRF